MEINFVKQAALQSVLAHFGLEKMAVSLGFIQRGVASGARNALPMQASSRVQQARELAHKNLMANPGHALPTGMDPAQHAKRMAQLGALSSSARTLPTPGLAQPLIGQR
jgi:hypothetical protein